VSAGSCHELKENIASNWKKKCASKDYFVLFLGLRLKRLVTMQHTSSTHFQCHSLFVLGHLFVRRMYGVRRLLRSTRILQLRYVTSGLVISVYQQCRQHTPSCMPAGLRCVDHPSSMIWSPGTQSKIRNKSIESVIKRIIQQTELAILFSASKQN